MLFVILFHSFPPVAQTSAIKEGQSDLGSLSLESLSSIEITSVSRKQQKLAEAAGGVFVITSEDIRRSGLNSLAELLRIVPGLDVAEIDANKWSITARDFGERYPDKMLVLLDGRTLYSPLTSGVTWDVQETLLEDVERIEIVRGPGATLWGANAVNGVVNIVTKATKDTLGLLSRGTLSAQGRNGGATRYGGRLGERVTYRGFTQYFDRGGSWDPLGVTSSDGWHNLRVGGRTDWDVSTGTTCTVEGDIFRERVGTTVPGLISVEPASSGLFVDKTITSDGDLIGRWTNTSERWDTMTQGYVDLENRNEIGVLGEFRHAFDLEFVERYHPGGRHDLLLGSDFRYNSDRTVGSINISFTPASRATQLYGVFTQDEIGLVRDELKLILRCKLEHNYYSGYAVQPNLHLIWIPGDRTSTWIAISRASESSSRTDADVRTNENPQLQADGSTTMESDFGTAHLLPENVTAYELGARFQLSHILSFDTATFYNHYTNRHTNEPGTPYVQPSYFPITILPTYVRSNIYGETHGLELLVRTYPVKRLQLTGSYSPFQIHLHQTAASSDLSTARESEDSTPRQKVQVHSLLTLPQKVEFDVSLYYVGQLVGQNVPRYTRLDLRSGWRPTPSLELSVGGRNLTKAEHLEFSPGELVQSEPVARSAYLEATWRH